MDIITWKIEHFTNYWPHELYLFTFHIRINVLTGPKLFFVCISRFFENFDISVVYLMLQSCVPYLYVYMISEQKEIKNVLLIQWYDTVKRINCLIRNN